MKSLETGYWIDEEPYELADAFPSAQVTNLLAPYISLYALSLGKDNKTALRETKDRKKG
jgi:hypothetical protein